MRALTQATARSEPKSGQRIQVRSIGLFFKTKQCFSLVYETTVRPRWFGIVDDIDACLRALTQATARSDPKSSQRVEVRGHRCLLGTDVRSIGLFFKTKRCFSLLVYETRVRSRWFGIVDDIDACLRARTKATAYSDSESGQHVEVCGHRCALGTHVRSIGLFFKNQTVLLTSV